MILEVGTEFGRPIAKEFSHPPKVVLQQRLIEQQSGSIQVLK
jgi:hypothetical protein